jgi:phosphatidylglycerol:prolipoprotein diacylglycerol transferase
MHPILFEIPLPALKVQAWPLLGMVAVCGVALGAYGWRQRARDLWRTGAGVAAVAALLAWLLRSRTYTIEPLPVYSYGALLCLSLVVGWVLTSGLGQQRGMDRARLANVFLISLFAALAGARLLYVFTNWREFPSFAEALALRRGGFVAYGGFLGGFLGAWLYLRRGPWRFARWADVAAPSVALGIVLTRIGCYLFGCDFGKPLPTGAPEWLQSLGVFPRWPASSLGAGSPAWLHHVDHRGLPPHAPGSLPVHPTQLYEALAAVGVFLLLLRVRKRQRFDGQMLLTCTIAYGWARFCIETLRDDPERGSFGPSLPAHWYVGSALLAFAIAYAIGPARSIAARALRQGTRVLALVPAAVAFAVLVPRGASPGAALQLSTSQWIALATTALATWAWTRHLPSLTPRGTG